MNNIKFSKYLNLSHFRIVSFYCALVFVVIALFGLFSRNLALGLDFTGGYLTEFSTKNAVSQKEMTELLTSYLPENFKVTSADEARTYAQPTCTLHRSSIHRSCNRTLCLDDTRRPVGTPPTHIPRISSVVCRRRC